MNSEEPSVRAIANTTIRLNSSTVNGKGKLAVVSATIYPISEII